MNLTETQSRLYSVLQDGAAHTVQELIAAMDDELTSPNNVKTHISNIRQQLRPRGYDILCVWDRRRRLYRLVRTVSPMPGGSI